MFGELCDDWEFFVVRAVGFEFRCHVRFGEVVEELGEREGLVCENLEDFC